MLVLMYSFKPIPFEKRTTWEFPVWPYTEDDDEWAKFEDFMKENSIFYYADPIPMNKDGKYIKDIFLKLDTKDFIGYKHLLNVDPDTLHIMSWPKSAQNRRNPNMKHIHRTMDHHGDDAAWEMFNIPGEIETDYANRVLKFTQLDDYVETTQEPKCKKQDPKGNKPIQISKT